MKTNQQLHETINQEYAQLFTLKSIYLSRHNAGLSVRAVERSMAVHERYIKILKHTVTQNLNHKYGVEP
jgi:hypothetical protein